MSVRVRHEQVGSRAARDRFRVAHLSDFHLWCGDRKLRRIEPVLAEWQPDALALTGDYADTPMGQNAALEWIRRMAALFPLCWVAGNHDGWWGGSFLRRLTDVRQAHPVDLRDAVITGKAGRRCRFTSWARFASASADGPPDDPVIVLAHDPADMDAKGLAGRHASLWLAGHLHGGQINLWHDRDGRPQPAASFYPQTMGRAEIGPATLVVSGGLGDTLPLRVRAPKEIVLVDWSPG